MAFTKEDIPVQFADLKSVLSQSKQIDPALYQTIQILIERLDKFKAGHDSVVNNVNNSVNSILQNITVTPNISATYITKANEVSALPLSIQLIAGAGITFDDSVANKRIISSTGGGAGGMNLDYFGSYTPGTYNDGDIVVGSDGVTYMCVKDGTTTPPETWPGGGSTGPVGPVGPPGPSSSVMIYLADTISTVASDPGAGKIRWNNVNQNLATFLYFDKLTNGGFDATTLLQSMGIQDQFIIQDQNVATTNQVWKLTGTPVAMGGNWFSVPVLFVSGTAVFTNNQHLAIVIKYGSAGANLDYFGDYVAGTYYDGDIVVGTDGIAYMCVKDGTTTPPESWPGGGGVGPHASTHITGGNDIIDVKLLGGYPGGTTNYLRADGTFGTPATGVPGAHASTHYSGGIDPVTITNLAGFPGGTINFLRADGTFATPGGGSGGTPAAHHTSHEIGGSDVIQNNAWLNQPNIFTASQKISIAGPSRFQLIDTSQPVDQRIFELYQSNKILYMQAANDALSVSLGNLQMDRTGNITTSGTIRANGGSTTASGGITHAGSFAEFRLVETIQPANSQIFRLLSYQGLFQIWPADDALNPSAIPLVLTRTGHAMIQGVLQMGLTGSPPVFSPLLPAWRHTGSDMECVLGDQSNWAKVRAGSFVSIGGGTTLADLTVTGGTNFAGGLSGTGNLSWNGPIISNGFIYPGRQDVPNQNQTSLYLASHQSYGLWTNTGMYLAGNLVCAGIGYIHTTGSPVPSALSVAADGTSGISQTGVVIKNTASISSVMFMSYHATSGAMAGNILQNGGANATAVLFQSASDKRIKNDLGRSTDLNSLRKVVIHDFTWKINNQRDRGIFAQDAYEFFPNAITPGTDELISAGDFKQPWMTDYSKLVPDLIAGWQEHDTEIAKLKAILKKNNIS